MSRADFMKSLSELLVDVSPAEREEAIQYYNDYFDDAGAENEQSVIASLGTPEQLARTIKAGLSDGGNTGEFTEKGFSGYEQKKSNEVLNPNRPGEENGRDAERQSGNRWQSDSNRRSDRGNNNDNNSQNPYGPQGNYNYQNPYGSRENPTAKQEKKPMSGGTIALIVILCILASPFLVGIGGSILGIIIGLLGALFGVVLGFGITAVVLLIVGVALFVYGVTLLFGAPLGGLCAIGAAMVCMAVGLLFFWIVVMLCAVLVPALIRGIVKVFQNIFQKGGVAA